jgi:rod shape determining protein RodA
MSATLGGTRFGRPSLRLDGWLLFAVAILIGSGLLSIYSVGAAHDETFFKKQLLFLAMGVVPLALFYFLPLSFWLRSAKMFYVLSLGLLVWVLFRGKSSHGSHRWIMLGSFQFEPNEVVKLLIVIAVAAFLTLRYDRIRELSTHLLSLLLIVPPFLMTAREPETAAAMVLFVVWFCVALVAGVPLRYLGATILILGTLVGVIALVNPKLIFQPYQIPRIEALLAKNSAMRSQVPLTKQQQAEIDAAAYQAMRAELAFGSGGVVGSGFLRGEQTNSGLIPEQHDDFIFTVVGEEGGLIGASLVLAAFGLFFFRLWLIMLKASEPFHRMLIAGIIGLLAFHMADNLFMILQIIPVAGLWLPFMSYGGSALWLCMACVGLALNVNRREQPVLFN